MKRGSVGHAKHVESSRYKNRYEYYEDKKNNRTEEYYKDNTLV